VDYASRPLDFYQSRDEAKRQLAKASDITLIVVPYWWDGTEDR